MEKDKQLSIYRGATPGFVQKALESMESAKEYAKLIGESELAPNHFYHTKKEDGKNVPDFTKPKIASILMVLQHGSELGLSTTQSLQEIIPTNGMLSIKGDGAKALIMSSGICESWEEKETGSIQDDTYKVTITSRRKGGNTITRSFSVEDAKRAGLWVTEDKLKRNDAWKFKLSPWYKYPKRMIMYRAIGFISRDLYSDVLKGMVTYEEAMDYKKDEEIILTGTDGKQVHVSKAKIDHDEDNNKDISSKVADKMDSRNSQHEDIQDVEEITGEVPGDLPWEGAENDIDKDDLENMKYTEAYLMSLGANEVDDIAYKRLSKANQAILEAMPGRKSKKRTAGFIIAVQEGKAEEYKKQFFYNDDDEKEKKSNVTVEENKEKQDVHVAVDDDKESEGLEPDKSFDVTTSNEDTGSNADDVSADILRYAKVDPGEDGRDTEAAFGILFGFTDMFGDDYYDKFEEDNKKLFNGRFKNMDEFGSFATESDVRTLLEHLKK